MIPDFRKSRLLDIKFMHDVFDKGTFDHNRYADRIYKLLDSTTGQHYTVRSVIETKGALYSIYGYDMYFKEERSDYDDRYTTVKKVIVNSTSEVIMFRMSGGIIRHPYEIACSYSVTEKRVDGGMWSYYCLDGVNFFDTYTKCMELLTEPQREELLMERLRHDS